jgi:hypothetical protein
MLISNLDNMVSIFEFEISSFFNNLHSFFFNSSCFYNNATTLLCFYFGCSRTCEACMYIPWYSGFCGCQTSRSITLFFPLDAFCLSLFVICAISFKIETIKKYIFESGNRLSYLIFVIKCLEKPEI